MLPRVAGLLVCRFFFCEMDHFAQNPYFCSQPEEVVGAEIFLVLIVHFSHSQVNLESIEWKRE